MIDRHKTPGYRWPDFEGDALPDTLWDTLPKNGTFHRGIKSFGVSQVIYLLLKSSEVIEGQMTAHGGSL